MDAVGRHHLGAEDAVLLDLGDHRHAVFRLAVGHFLAGLRQVGVQRYVELDRQRRAACRISGGQV